jgi:hypothetical protein
VKVVGDEAILRSSKMSLAKIIKKSDVLSVQEECRMLAQVITNRNYVVCN